MTSLNWAKTPPC